MKTYTDEEQRILAIRRETAEKIKTKAEDFKICIACGSIVLKKAIACTNCNSYRFDPDPEEVKRQAELLATRLPQSVEEWR